MRRNKSCNFARTMIFKATLFFGLLLASTTVFARGFKPIFEPESRWALHQPEKSDAIKEGARIAIPEETLPAFTLQVSALRGLTVATFVLPDAPIPAKRRPFHFAVHSWELALLLQRDTLFVPNPDRLPTVRRPQGAALLAAVLYFAEAPRRSR
jgi:hypothetical protein